MLIDLLNPLFPFGTQPFLRLMREIQRGLIREAAATGQDLILTTLWDFADPHDPVSAARLDEFVSECGGRAYFAELEAPLQTRIERNRSPERRASKDVSWATPEYLSDVDARHRTSCDGEFPYPDRSVLVETSRLTAAQAAQRIKVHFGFT